MVLIGETPDFSGAVNGGGGGGTGILGFCWKWLLFTECKRVISGPGGGAANFALLGPFVIDRSGGGGGGGCAAGGSFSEDGDVCFVSGEEETESLDLGEVLFEFRRGLVDRKKFEFLSFLLLR